MFQLLSETVPQPDEKDLGVAFKERYGIGILDFMRIGFAIFSIVCGGRTEFSAWELNAHAVPALAQLLTRENVEAFLRCCSLNIDQFRRELATTRDPAAGLEHASFNPLFRHPIVQVGNRYIAPSTGLLVQAFTSGIYYALLDDFLGDRTKVTGYTSMVGRIFEQYVGEELSSFLTGKELRPAVRYGAGWDGPDWTIIEGNRAVLIECKSGRLSKAERERGDIAAVRARLKEKGGIIEAIAKLPEKTRHIREHAKGLEDWPDISEFEFVIVTLDPWWTETVMRVVIDEELASMGKFPIRYHLMWIEQLEQLESYRTRTSLFDLLRERDLQRQRDTREYLSNRARELGIITRSTRMAALNTRFFEEWLPGQLPA